MSKTQKAAIDYALCMQTQLDQKLERERCFPFTKLWPLGVLNMWFYSEKPVHATPCR